MVLATSGVAYKLSHLCGSGGHGHVIRSDSDVNTLFQLRTEVKRLGPLLTGFLSGAPGNKQTNGWVNRNIPVHTIACSRRRWLDKVFAESLVQASVSMIFLFPVHSDQCMSNIHRYPQAPQMDQQYKMLLILPIWSSMNGLIYHAVAEMCQFISVRERSGLLFFIYEW